MIFQLFSVFSLDYVELPSAVQKVDPEDCEEGNVAAGYMTLYKRLTLWLVRLHLNYQKYMLDTNMFQLMSKCVKIMKSF